MRGDYGNIRNAKCNYDCPLCKDGKKDCRRCTHCTALIESFTNKLPVTIFKEGTIRAKVGTGVL